MIKRDFSSVLADAKIVDLSRGLSGAFCSFALGQIGAEVIALRDSKYEARNIYAEERARIDGGKTVVDLDCYSPDAFDELKEITANADLIVEERLFEEWPSGKPISLDLMALNPRLSALCLSPFGLSGPKGSQAGSALSVYHSAGHAMQIPFDPLWQDYRDRPPLAAGGNWGESQSGLVAAIGALSLFASGDEGRGRLIDCSKQEALVHMHWTEMVRYPNDGSKNSRLSPNVTYIGGIFKVSDGHVQIVVMEDHQWEALGELLDRPAWMTDPQWNDKPTRLAHQEQLVASLAAQVVNAKREDLFLKGQRLGIPIAPILALRELRASNTLTQRGTVRPERAMPRWDSAVWRDAAQ